MLSSLTKINIKKQSCRTIKETLKMKAWTLCLTSTVFMDRNDGLLNQYHCGSRSAHLLADGTTYRNQFSEIVCQLT